MGPIPAFDISSPAFKADPYPTYARLRAEAPVHRVRLSWWMETWLVTRFEDVDALLRDNERFSNDVSHRLWFVPRRLKLNDHMLSSDPPDHMRLRTLVSKAFTPRAIERLRERVQQTCDRLLDAAAARGELEVVGDFALQLPLAIIADLLGVPEEERRPFNTWTQRVTAGSSLAVIDLLKGLPALWVGIGYIRGLVARRRAEPGDDLVSALVMAEENGDHLTEDEVGGMVALLLIAGFETTMSLISLGTLALVQHPDQRQRFQEEPALADSAIEELLRFTSPLDTSFFRIARDEVSIAGVALRRGSVALAMLGSANRDETRFPQPEVLDLARSPNRHVAFGAGPHFCMGAPLARMEGRIALTTLFRRFPALRLAVPATSLRYRRGPMFRSLDRLPITLS